MEIKTGVDIVEVSRIKESIEKYGERFLNRVYTKKEIEYCNSKNVQKFQSYAARFAAKEAVFKAISEYLNNKFNIEWNNIEIINNSEGKPFVYLNETLQEKLKIKNFKIDISLSHIELMAIANVVIVGEKL